MSEATSLIGDLERALGHGTEAQRVEMLSRVTDLFLSNTGHYSASQLKLFDDVIAKLAAAIEPMARAKLATRLAPTPDAPAGVIRQLAFDDNIEVARPVLRLSECLNDDDLIANANSKSQQHLIAIAERKELHEAVTDALVVRGDREVVRTVSKNYGAQFSHGGFRVLVKRASDDEALALQLGARSDLPRQLFMRLVDEASAAVRARLMTENADDASSIDAAVREVSGDIRARMPKATTTDYAAIREKLAVLHEAGALGEGSIFAFARDRQVPEAVVTLSLLCGVEDDVTERAFVAPANDMLLILAKLAGFSWIGAKALLTLKAGGRTLEPAEIERALADFGRLQIDTARNVLGFYHSRSSAA
jgi:uncharacterized protein (DUF2336 family)